MQRMNSLTTHEITARSNYTFILSKLKEECIAAFERTGNAVVSVDDRKTCALIFKEMTMDEFINQLLQSTSNPEIEFEKGLFRLKKAYPVNNIFELKDYLLQHGRYGIPDDENLKMCYINITRDIEELIQAGWVRVVKTHDGNRKTEKNEKRIFFPKNIEPPTKEDDQIEWDTIELPLKCHEYFDRQWEEISKNENQSEWEKIFDENPKLLCD